MNIVTCGHSVCSIRIRWKIFGVLKGSCSQQFLDVIIHLRVLGVGLDVTGAANAVTVASFGGHLSCFSVFYFRCFPTGQYKFTPLSSAEGRKFYDGSLSRINKALTEGEGLNLF
jgi:hypothetical protein